MRELGGVERGGKPRLGCIREEYFFLILKRFLKSFICIGEKFYITKLLVTYKLCLNNRTQCSC